MALLPLTYGQQRFVNEVYLVFNHAHLSCCNFYHLRFFRNPVVAPLCYGSNVLAAQTPTHLPTASTPDGPTLAALGRACSVIGILFFSFRVINGTFQCIFIVQDKLHFGSLI